MKDKKSFAEEIVLKIAYKIRFVPIIISVILAVVSFGKLSAASLPYQDPTAEMLQKQSQQIATAENWLIVSGVIFAASVVYSVIIARLYKRREHY